MADPARCRRCGRCCFAKLIIRDRIVYTPYPCRHLDIDTRLCTVYEKRHEVNPECLTVERGIQLGVFPPDCPYVSDLPGYIPPIPADEAEAWLRDVEAAELFHSDDESAEATSRDES